MRKRRSSEAKVLSIRKLATQFSGTSPAHLYQMGCCCCCCCIQAFVGAAAGLLAAPLALRIGLIPIRLRYRWPIVLRIMVLGLLLGSVQGVIAVGL